MGAPTKPSGPPPPPPLPIPLQRQTGSQRMKKLNWKKLSSHDLSKNCFWVKEQKCQTKNSLLVGLSQYFSLPNAVNNSASKSGPLLRILNANSAQNLMILFRVQFKNTSHDEIKKLILRCDTSALNSNFVDSLIKCLPYSDKMKKLHEMSNDGTKLLDVEKFVASLYDIKRLEARLHCIKFKLVYSNMVEDLEPNIKSGVAACQEIISSIKFGRVLNLILSIGNMMNSGSTISGAMGFDLEILAKLHDVKGARKYTLLHFIVETISHEFPECLNFADELRSIDEAACISFDEIKETIEQIKSSSNNLQEELNQLNVSERFEDKFVEAMSPFALECQRQIEVLGEMMNLWQNIYIKVGEYFAFDVNKSSM